MNCGETIRCKKVKIRERPPAWLERQASPLGAPRWIHDLAQQAHEAFEQECGYYGVQQMVKVASGIMDEMQDRTERTMTFLEVCAGWGETSYWVKSHGGAAQEFDAQTRHEDENLNTFVGILLLFHYIDRIIPRGTCLMTPECSKWTFFSCSTMGRNLTVHGFQFRQDAINANVDAQPRGLPRRPASGSRAAKMAQGLMSR